uniref:Uncharacterized protein n=1 Tax=Plectus sambesii TaxID=2011161 RepID=A0A914W277_9BILA
MQSTFGSLLLLSLIAVAVAYRPGPMRRLLVLEDLLNRIEVEQQRNSDDDDSAQYDATLGDDLPANVDEDSIPVAPYTVEYAQAPRLAAFDAESFSPIQVVRRMPTRYPIRLWNKRSGSGVNFYGMRG